MMTYPLSRDIETCFVGDLMIVVRFLAMRLPFFFWVNHLWEEEYISTKQARFRARCSKNDKQIKSQENKNSTDSDIGSIHLKKIPSGAPSDAMEVREPPAGVSIA
jgi:hypothetical protein